MVVTDILCNWEWKIPYVPSFESNLQWTAESFMIKEEPHKIYYLKILQNFYFLFDYINNFVILSQTGTTFAYFADS